MYVSTYGSSRIINYSTPARLDLWEVAITFLAGIIAFRKNGRYASPAETLDNAPPFLLTNTKETLKTTKR